MVAAPYDVIGVTGFVVGARGANDQRRLARERIGTAPWVWLNAADNPVVGELLYGTWAFTCLQLRHLAGIGQTRSGDTGTHALGFL